MIKLYNPLKNKVSITYKGIDYSIEPESSYEVSVEVSDHWMKIHSFLIKQDAKTQEIKKEDEKKEVEEDEKEEEIEESEEEEESEDEDEEDLVIEKDDGKEECPECGKMYKNLGAHMKAHSKE